MSPASVTYFHGDHLGSSVVLTSGAGGSPLVRHVIYRPYGGVVVEAAGGSIVPPEIGFTGQRFEQAAALYDYGARWYDPQLGRFLQPDPLIPEPFNPQSLSRYSYVMNDPVNRIDPSGRSSMLIGTGYIGESYYNDNFQQPPWERAGRIDLGLSRSDPTYLGLRQRPDPVYLASMPDSTAQENRPGASQPGGFLPVSYNDCGARLCNEQPNPWSGLNIATVIPIAWPARAVGVARVGSLTNAQARAIYRTRLSEIQGVDAELARAGLALRERALRAFQARFDAKLETRALMADRALADSLPPAQTLSDMVRKGYQEGLRGDDLWRSILESSTRSNKGIDALTGGP